MDIQARFQMLCKNAVPINSCRSDMPKLRADINARKNNGNRVQFVYAEARRCNSLLLLLRHLLVSIWAGLPPLPLMLLWLFRSFTVMVVVPAFVVVVLMWPSSTRAANPTGGSRSAVVRLRVGVGI